MEVITGIDTYFEYFQDVPWCHFYDVIEYRWYRKFDDVMETALKIAEMLGL